MDNATHTVTIDTAHRTLDTVPIGGDAVLASPRTEPRLRRRMSELGLRPGMTVTVTQRTAGGGRVVRTGGSRYAIDAVTLREMAVVA